MRVLVRATILGGELWWVAQCIEHSLAVQGRTMAGALNEFRDVLVAHDHLTATRSAVPLSDLPPADESVREDFNLYALRV